MIATNKILWYISQLWEVFKKPQMWNFLTIIMWLISEWKKTLLSISKKIIWSNKEHFINLKKHDGCAASLEADNQIETNNLQFIYRLNEDKF